MNKINTNTTWKKPKHFDCNVLVIGAGAAGLVASYIAAAVKAKVILVEKHKMGGDCLNTGCVPSKALINSTRFLAQCRTAEQIGIQQVAVDFDFARIMQHVQDVVTKVAPHDSVERYSDLGVEVLIGTASIQTPWQVNVSSNGQHRIIHTCCIIIATGARPFIPPIPGLQEIPYLTSDSIWGLRKKPDKLLVLGGGPIGCELAQAFSRMQVSVIQVEMQPRLLMREDVEVSQAIMQQFNKEGIELLLNHKAIQFQHVDGKNYLIAETAGKQTQIEFDEVLVAIGRAANIDGYGADEIGIKLSPAKTIAVNDFLATNYSNIYACGDVAGPYQFTHAAAHQAWYAVVNALFGRFKRFKVDYAIMPWATFTDPEIARVGINIQQAEQQNIAYEVSRYSLSELDRAITDNTDQGFVQVLTKPGKDKILGVTIVGSHAGDLIAEFVLAMKHGLGMNKLLSTIHIYPTMNEANKYAAGVWRKQHTSQRLLNVLEYFHRLLRR